MSLGVFSLVNSRFAAAVLAGGLKEWAHHLEQAVEQFPAGLSQLTGVAESLAALLGMTATLVNPPA